MKNESDLSIALLIGDIAEAKSVSEALREMGIYAHFYQELSDFWVDTKTKIPDLAIIDIEKISEGDTLFENHPLVRSKALSFAIYYKEENKHSLRFSENLRPMGTIKKEINLIQQIQMSLNLHKREKFLVEQNIELINKLKNIKKNTDKLAIMAQTGTNLELGINDLNDFFDTLGSPKESRILMKNLCYSLNSWEHCFSFGIYSLSPNGQKLSSVEKVGSKFKTLPDLWLNIPCVGGMKSYAKNMASDISRDYLLNSIRSIEIKGKGEGADFLILGSFDEERLVSLDWDLFSEKLSSSYRYSLINESSTEQFEKEVSPFDALSLLDDIHFHQVESKYKFFHLDLSNLINLTKEKHSNRFYWKDFIKDFKSEMLQSLNGNFKFSFYGAQSVLLFVDKEHIDQDFQRLKLLINEFSYHKFFEDSSLLITGQYKAELSTLAPSSANFLRKLETKTHFSLEQKRSQGVRENLNTSY